MQDSMRATILIAGAVLLAAAAVLLGKTISGESDLNPWASLALGLVGLGVFAIGLFIPRGVLQRPGGALGVDMTNLDVHAPAGSIDEHE